jgi:hypothetical protein
MIFPEDRPDSAAPEEGFADRFKDTYNFGKKGLFGRKGVTDRAFPRAGVSFPFKYSVIFEKEAEELRSIYLNMETKDRTGRSVDPPREEEAGTMAGAIMERLDRIEKKLDRILGEGAVAETRPAGSPMETAYARDISGAGIRMGSVQLLSLGWDLNIEIDTLEPYPLKISALGRVIRNLPDIEGSINESAFEFVGIHEEDRKAIGSFVHRRQRESARIRHVD